MTDSMPAETVDQPSPQKYGLDESALRRIVGQLREATWGPWENPLATDDELNRFHAYISDLASSRKSGGGDARGPVAALGELDQPLQEPRPEDVLATEQLITRVHNQRLAHARGGGGNEVATIQEQCRVGLYELSKNQWTRRIAGSCSDESAAAPALAKGEIPASRSPQSLRMGSDPSTAAPSQAQELRSNMAGHVITSVFAVFGMILGGAIGRGVLGAVVGAALLGGVGAVLVSMMRPRPPSA